MSHIAKPSNMRRLADELPAGPIASEPRVARDAIGLAADDAWMFVDIVYFALAKSRFTSIPAEQRREALTAAFTAWPSLCERMKWLEELAPNCAAAGYEKAALARDVRERKAGAHG